MTESADRLAHDLRHLLTAVLGALDNALVRPGTPADTRADLVLARTAAERAGALLGGEANPEVVALHALLRARAPLLEQILGPAIRLDLVLPPPDPRVRADRTEVDRVLSNLAANARAAMPDGGTLVLRAGQAGDFATIAAEDNGTGLSPEVAARMFEPGFSTKKGSGHGLGLAIVRDIVAAAGGFLSARGAPGHGATITVHWPIVARDAAPPVGRVLLVDDEPMVRQLAEHALRHAGWEVVAAASGMEALAAVERCGPDVVVSDVTMPGMDGPGLITALRVRWPNLPAILVSGYADSARWVDPGGVETAFLAKPYTLAALVAAVAGAFVDGVRD